MSSEIDKLLGKYSVDSLTPTSGLPELSDEMHRSLEANFHALKTACKALSTEIATLEDLLNSRSDFNRNYGILKLIAVSSINLIDSPSPSLPLLDIDSPFEIKVDETAFTVF